MAGSAPLDCPGDDNHVDMKICTQLHSALLFFRMQEVTDAPAPGLQWGNNAPLKEDSIKREELRVGVKTDTVLLRVFITVITHNAPEIMLPCGLYS